jgi:hypothetical protein
VRRVVALEKKVKEMEEKPVALLLLMPEQGQELKIPPGTFEMSDPSDWSGESPYDFNPLDALPEPQEEKPPVEEKRNPNMF